MLAEVVVPTALVATVNVPVVDPAPIVTLAGTTAAALLLDSATAAPPAGAGSVNVTVPVEALPPMTELGFKEMVASAGVLMVRIADFKEAL
jgi:hypothetical protein